MADEPAPRSDKFTAWMAKMAAQRTAMRPDLLGPLPPVSWLSRTEAVALNRAQFDDTIDAAMRAEADTEAIPITWLMLHGENWLALED